MRISAWSSDVCSSDLQWGQRGRDIAVPTIEISRIVPDRQRIDMTRDEVWQHRPFRKFRFLHTELRPRASAGYILPDIAQHTLETSEGFLLIFLDRRLLRIGPPVPALPLGVHRTQPFFPVLIEGLDEDSSE